MIEILTKWISGVETGGLFGRYSKDGQTDYDFKSIDLGLLDAANALLKQITDSPKLTKSMLGDLIVSNTPYTGSTPFTTRTGYAQVKNAGKDRSRAYGVFDFNTSIAPIIFSEYL